MRNRYLAFSSCALLALAGATAARAQDTRGDASQAAAQDAGSAADGNEIVVTAQGREQRLNDVPVSVSVVGGLDLQKQNITGLEALSIRQPNFRIARSPASDYVVVRGIGSSANIGFEQSVGTFVDGLYRGRSRATRAALFDLDRVEILKGPQTTFFGNNSIAGALNISTRKPGSEFAMNGTASYMPNTGEYLVEAGVTVPLNDRLSIRVAGRQSGMDGYIKNVQRNDEGPHESNQIGRVALAWKPVDGVAIDARVDVSRMRQTGVFDIELLECPPPAPFSGPAGACNRYLQANSGVVDSTLDWTSAANPSYFNYDMVEAMWSARIDAGENLLTLTTGYFHHSYDLLNDPVPIPGKQGGSAVGMDMALPIVLSEKYRQFSQEVRFASPEDRWLSFMFGAYYQHGQLDVDLKQGYYFAPVAAATGGLVPTATPIAGTIVSQERSDLFSAFAALTVNPTEKLHLSIGGRFSLVDKHAQRATQIGTAGSVPSDANFVPLTVGLTQLYGATGLDPGNYAAPHRSDSAFLPSVNLRYDIADGAMVYASYVEGFKAGGFSIGTTNSSFDPEHVKSYELGLKADLFDRAMTLTLAGFYSKYRDLQETATVTSGSVVRQVVTNAANSTVKGVELGLTLRPVPNLTLTGNVAYLSSRYADYPNAPCTTAQQAVSSVCTQNLSGEVRAFAPKFSGNVGIAYTQPIGDYELTFDASTYFTTRFLQVATGDYRISQPGNAKLDLRLGFGPANGRWEVAILAKNLTNTLTAGYRQIVPSATGSIAALADPPRSIGFQVSFRQ